MTSPYDALPPRAFWRSAVAGRAADQTADLYVPRFPITAQTRIATAGSCFAQHVGRALRAAGCTVLDAEPLPDAIPDAVAQRFGYRLFSGRYGNIYTARQWLQLLREMRGKASPALTVWERDGRFHDAQRPNVEPEGLDSADFVLAHRRRHLATTRRMLAQADVFVFTFGLTEAWVHRATGTVYPTAPGTVAGIHDPDIFAFHNFDVAEVLADFEQVRLMMKARAPDLKFLVTVSPVPLTATASGQHVEVATAYSKAVLRAVCGMLVTRHDDVDYFPSYEIITSQTARGAYFEENLRSVTPQGVATAMETFLTAHGLARAVEAPVEVDDGQSLICEEAMLDAF